MKTNKMLRISAILLVLTLLSTCVISGTFAKYVTKGEATDTARVAKWGVTITAETPVHDEYETDLETKDDEIITDTTVKTLAPGSGVKFANINISGKPEVACVVNYEAELILNGWVLEDKTTEYVPLVFVINGVEYKDAKAADLKTKVENAIKEYGKIYAANTDLSTVAAEELVVSCYWAYNGTNDAGDTYYGDLAALGSGPTISLKITCTVTQID